MMSNFAKAIEGTDTYEVFGEDLISFNMFRRYIGCSNSKRDKALSEIEYVEVEDVAQELMKDENCDNVELMEEIWRCADLEYDLEEDIDAWGLVYKAFDILNIEF